MQRIERKHRRRTRRLDQQAARHARRRRMRQGMACLGITMGAMAALAGDARGQVSTGGFGGGYGSETISSGSWQANYDIGFSGFNGVSSLFGTGGNTRLDQVGALTYYFRTDGDADERSLSSFNFVAGGTTATNAASATFTDSTALDISLGYRITSTSERSVRLTDTLTVTNTSAAPFRLDVFNYSNYDLDGARSGDIGQRTNTNEFRQRTTVGSFIDTRSTAVRTGFPTTGQNPGPFELSSRNGTSTLTDRLGNDGAVTNLPSAPVQLGPDDVEHAFQFIFPNLLPGESTTITTTRDGLFADVVFPAPPPPGDPTPPFVFRDPTPPRPDQRPRWYDPEVAVGYDYVINDDSDSQFAELYLPSGFEDGTYTLIITDPDHPLFGQEITVTGDYDSLSYDFTTLMLDGAGIDSFRILGIEPEAGIDPADALGFPTGLTFVGTGAAVFTQTAIVPEPATLALAAGAAAFGFVRRRRTAR